MQGKKHIVQLSFIAMMTSLIVFTVLEFRLYPHTMQIWIFNILKNNAKTMENYLITIFSGIFTGAILSLFVALREYVDAKTYDLLEYYEVCSLINRKICKIPYLDIRQPYDIVEACIAEEDDNKRRARYNEKLKKAIEVSRYTGEDKHIVYEKNHEEMVYSAKVKMQEYIWERQNAAIKETLEEAGQKNRFLEQEYNDVIKKYYTEIDEIMQYYIEFSKIDYWQVENGYGKIDFLFGNKKKRNRFIYEKLHDKERGIIRKIQGKVRHFYQYYQDDIGSLQAPLREIVDMQKHIFEKVNEEWGYTVYNKLNYELDVDLINLLKLIHGLKYKGEVLDKKYYAVCSWKNE